MKNFWLFVLAVIAIAVIFSGNNRNVTRTSLKSQNQETAATQQRIKDKKFFLQHKNEIIANVKKLLQEKKYLEARTLSKKYLFVKDTDIIELYKKADGKYKRLKTKQILAELKKIPESNYAKNKHLYSILLNLDPSNVKYKKKYDYYSKKLNHQKRYERLVSQGLAWNYEESKDTMTGKLIKRAIVRSSNTINFQFPYGGAQRATLILRKHPRYGNDVIISIEKGQFLCSLSGCSVVVKFDENKPLRFSASEPSDHSSTVLFINNFTRFVTKAKKSKKIYIETEFFREGARVLEFVSEGLKF